MSVAAAFDEFRGREHLAIDGQPRALQGPQQQLVFARRQFHERRGAHQIRRGTVGAQTFLGIFQRQFRETKRRDRVSLDRCGRGEVPRRVRANIFHDLDAHFAGRQIARDHGRGGRDEVEALPHVRRRERAAMDRDLVDLAVKRGVELAAHRRADPQIVVIHHGGGVRFSAHVPHARDDLAVNVAAETVAFAERVRHRDMMPARVRREARLGGPAMPVRIRGVGRFRRIAVAKQERQPRFAGLFAQSQRVVLIHHRSALRARAPLADDIDHLAGLEFRRGHPGFQRETVALVEIERAVRAAIMHADMPRRFAEGDRRAVVGEIGKLRRRLRGVAERNFAADRSAQRVRVLAGREALDCFRVGIVQRPVGGRFVREHEFGVARGRTRGVSGGQSQ